MSWLIRSLAFQHEVRRNEHFTRRAVASLPVCHWHSSPIVLRCSYFCYIKFNSWHWFVLISHRIAFCPISHCQDTRDKDFLFKPKWISYQISSVFALIAQVILFQLLFLSPEISKLKFLSRKAPGSILLLVFRLICCVTEIKKSTKDRKRKKRWAFLGKEERILLGDRVTKEILQNFIFLFHFVDSFLGRFLSSVSLRLGCSACWIFG